MGGHCGLKDTTIALGKLGFEPLTSRLLGHCCSIIMFSNAPSFYACRFVCTSPFTPLLVRFIIRSWGRFDTYRSGECCWVFVSWKSKSNLTVQNRAHAVSAVCNVKAHYSWTRMTDYHSGQPRAPSTLTHSAVQDVPRTSCLYQQLF